MTAEGIDRDVDQVAFLTPAEGLTAGQVGERIRAGLTNAAESHTSRTVAQIVRANVFTVFNGLLVTLFAIIAATGRWQNGLFGLVIVANSVIGIVQEVRARRTLDRLAVLSTPAARVVRDGSVAVVDVGAVVADDLLEVRTGDQVPADGVVRASQGLEIDESLLTGESDPVARRRAAWCAPDRSWSPAMGASRPPRSAPGPTRPSSPLTPGGIP